MTGVLPGTTRNTRQRADAPARRTRGIGTLLALAAAVAAGAALLVSPTPRPAAPPPPGRMDATTAWPAAQRADIPANLPDGPAYDPHLFLDAHTSVGTAPTPDGTAERLVLRRADGTVRQLRRIPTADNPLFGTVTVAGTDLVWTEVTTNGTFRLWAVDPRGDKPARLVTADTGEAIFTGSQYDLVAADGRLHWIAADLDNPKLTQIRSVALAGGPVTVRTQLGTWALSAWPWLVNGNTGPAGTTLLHDLGTGRQITVPATDGQTAACTPAWCRAVVTTGTATRIDLMRPDGDARRRIAAGPATAAIADVAPLDRFEILSEPGSGAGGAARLLAYDIATEATVDISADVNNVGYRNGVLWWSTGLREAIFWHTLDLRTT